MTFATTKRAMLVAAAVVCLLWTAAVAAQPVAGPAEIASQIEAARGEYGALLSDFEAARSDFEDFLVELDALKGEREDATAIANDDAVRDALREAREMALTLRDRSVAMRDLADRIAELEQQLRAQADSRLAELEQQLRLDPTTNPGVDRAQILNEINALSELRSSYTQPIQAVPEVQFDAILLDLEEETTPEELLATADELSDNERRLAEHLTELDERISSLESQLELRDRDLMFRREAALFEEGRNTGRSASRSAASGSTAAADTDRSATVDTSEGTQNTGDSGDPVGVVDLDGDVVPTAGASEGAGGDELSGGGAEPNEQPPGEYDDGMPTDSSGGLNGDDNGFSGDDGSRSADDPGAGWESPTLSPPALSGESGPRSDPTVLWMNELDEEDDINLSVRDELNQLQRERVRASSTLEEIQRQRELLLQRVEELESLENY